MTLQLLKVEIQHTQKQMKLLKKMDVLGKEIGNVTANVHRDHGVNVITGIPVESFKGESRVEKVVLGDGTEIDADVVIVGIGVKPNTEKDIDPLDPVSSIVSS